MLQKRFNSIKKTTIFILNSSIQSNELLVWIRYRLWIAARIPQGTRSMESKDLRSLRRVIIDGNRRSLLTARLALSVLQLHPLPLRYFTLQRYVIT